MGHPRAAEAPKKRRGSGGGVGAMQDKGAPNQHLKAGLICSLLLACTIFGLTWVIPLQTLFAQQAIPHRPRCIKSFSQGLQVQYL